MKLLILFTLIYFISPVDFSSEIYRHVNEEGKVVYTNHRDGSRPSEPKKKLDIDKKHYREYISFIDKFSEQYKIDKNLIISIIFIESYFDKNAVSKRGACGLMQLMPETAKRFKVNDIFDPKENIMGGTAYLRHLYDFFDGDLKLILAAYNAGENIVKKFNGIPPYKETKNYVKKVTEIYSMLNKNTIYSYFDYEGNRKFTNDISLIPRGLPFKRFEINN